MEHQCAVPVGEYSPQHRFYQNGTALNRILLEAPYLSRCSSNKTASLIRPREHALRHPYMQINRRGMVSWLIFDLDHPNPFIWQDELLPPPNLVVRNTESGHSHLYYAIEPVCTTENARSKPIAYMKAIYQAFALRLQADADYHSGPVSKTPNHPSWATQEIHNKVYELDLLADHLHLEPTAKWKPQPNLDAVSHSRHCILFEQLRHYAYSIVNQERDKGSFSTFTGLLEIRADDLNNFHDKGFSQNLPLSSLKSTVKSVARWTWDYYRGNSRCHRGVMQLNGDIPLKERQRLSIARTHEIRKKATESKIRSACHQLKQRGKTLTQVAIANLVGIARQTVAAYKHVLKETAKIMTASPEREATPHISNVKNGVHQVTATASFLTDAADIGECLGFESFNTS